MSIKVAWFLSLVAIFVVGACTGARVTPSSSPASPSGAPTPTLAASAAAVTPGETGLPPASTDTLPVAFTSLLYRYSIVLPPGWSVRAAMLDWDGASTPGNQDGTIDKFIGPSSTTAWAYAAPVKVDLDGFVRDNIDWTVRDHRETCPATGPETTEPIEIGGEAGVLLSWDCGILISMAVLVRDGTGFVLVLRDPDVHAATDAADRAILEELLDSVTFPS